MEAAVGTDTSFSVIVCAQQNGICGLKPPVGTMSGDGIIPIAKTLDSAGSMAKDFSAALRLYLRTSAASRKTLREIVEYYEANPETMMKCGGKSGVKYRNTTL